MANMAHCLFQDSNMARNVYLGHSRQIDAHAVMLAKRCISYYIEDFSANAFGNVK